MLLKSFAYCVGHLRCFEVFVYVPLKQLLIFLPLPPLTVVHYLEEQYTEYLKCFGIIQEEIS